MNPKWVEPPPPTAVKPSLDYPESDGKPVGETDFHITVIFYLRAALRLFFRRAEKVYVAANMFLYYEEGKPSAVTCPDTFVVKGVARHDRRIYKLWEEKTPPCVTFEITSRSSRVEDLGPKKELYRLLGVREYFLFDPLEEHLKPRLQGFELAEGLYRPMAPGADGALRTSELGLILRPEGPFLRLADPATGLPLPTVEEAVEQAFDEAHRARSMAERFQDEARRANAAEAELARVRAELEKLRGRAGG